jgi:uncharacterized protein (TIGR03000 family)
MSSTNQAIRRSARRISGGWAWTVPLLGWASLGLALPAAAQSPRGGPGYYIGGYSGGNNRGGYSGVYIGGYPSFYGRGDAGGYYIGGYPGVDPTAMPGPSYPTYAPGYKGYSSRFSLAPESSLRETATPADAALIDVRVPPSAELWFEGRKTGQSGPDRRFVSPKLAPGKTYVYSVRARWNEGGKPVEESRDIKVQAGEHVRIRLTKGSGATGQDSPRP